MKKQIILTALACMMTVTTAFAEKDVLLETNPANAIVGTDDYLVETVRPETAEQIMAFAQQWAHAREVIATAKEHQMSGTLTETDKLWLDSDVKKILKREYSYASLFDDRIIGRVHFYERSHNWNGENEGIQTYNYVTYKGAGNQGSEYYTNSYGFNVLRTMADAMRTSMYAAEVSDLQGDAFAEDVKNRLTSILEQTQSTVQNDELRYYVNNTVWYATKQVVKERRMMEPR